MTSKTKMSTIVRTEFIEPISRNSNSGLLAERVFGTTDRDGESYPMRIFAVFAFIDQLGDDRDRGTSWVTGIVDVANFHVKKILFRDVRDANAVTHENVERRNVELGEGWSAMMLQTKIPGGMLTTDFRLDQRDLRSRILKGLGEEPRGHLVDGGAVGDCSLMEFDHDVLRLCFLIRWCYSNPS